MLTSLRSSSVPLRHLLLPTYRTGQATPALGGSDATELVAAGEWRHEEPRLGAAEEDQRGEVLRSHRSPFGRRRCWYGQAKEYGIAGMWRCSFHPSHKKVRRRKLYSNCFMFLIPAEQGKDTFGFQLA